MVMASPGVTGNPDWQPNSRFSGTVLVSGDNVAGSSSQTYGPFFVGDSLTLGLLCQVTANGSGYTVAVNWFADAAGSELVATQTYGGVADGTVYDTIGVIAPFFNVVLTAVGAGSGNDWLTSIWKSQNYPGTVLPLATPGALIAVGTPVANGTPVLTYSNIITRAQMSYYFLAAGGADSVISLSTVDGAGDSYPLLQTNQLDLYGNAFAQGVTSGSVNQLLVTMTNNGGGTVDMNASLVLL